MCPFLVTSSFCHSIVFLAKLLWSKAIAFSVPFHFLVQLVAEDASKLGGFQLRVFGEQVAVGVGGVGARGGAEHLQVFDLDRFLLGLGLEGVAFVG